MEYLFKPKSIVILLSPIIFLKGSKSIIYKKPSLIVNICAFFSSIANTLLRVREVKENNK